MYRARVDVARWKVHLPLLLLALLLLSRPAYAQIDIMGSWRPLPNDGDGLGLNGDAAGLPITAEARWRSESWSPNEFDMAEWVCRPHSFDYSLERPLSAMRVWADIDQPT